MAGVYITFLLRRLKVSILLTADASSLCFFKPTVVISQDLSCFEPEVLESASYNVPALAYYKVDSGLCP